MANRTAASGQTLPNVHVPLSSSGAPLTVKADHASGNTLVVYGDKGLWDPTASKAVSVDKSTVGTTLCPKL